MELVDIASACKDICKTIVKAGTSPQDKVGVAVRPKAMISKADPNSRRDDVL
jgi:hypothetical protein